MSSKISALGSLAGSGVQQTADMVPIVDTSVTQSKSILISELSLAQNKNGTEQSLTSGLGLGVTFNLPSWLTRVTVMIAGASTNGTSALVLAGQNGPTTLGAVVTQAGAVSAYATNLVSITASSLAASVWEAVIELTKENASDNTWAARSFASTSNAATAVHRGVGRFIWDGTTISVTTVVGDTFDAGVVNILYS